MNRVFLDANVLFSAAWRANAGLLRLWQLSDTILLTSRYAAEEARRNLETEEQRQRLTTLMVEIQLISDRAYGNFPPDVFLPKKTVRSCWRL
ncbi:MAG: hypothetical protein ACREYC_27130 [Gammaproteobacteria bacterium]